MTSSALCVKYTVSSGLTATQGTDAKNKGNKLLKGRQLLPGEANSDQALGEL